MAFVFLNKICTFVKQSSFRRNPKLFIYDKRLPKGNKIRKVCCQFLELDCNSKGNLAHKFISTMQSEKKFVTNSQRAEVTPAQQNQITFNQLVAKYVKQRLAYKHLFSGPVKSEYVAIYNQSLKPNLL